jgi:hypothetical protein
MRSGYNTKAGSGAKLKVNATEVREGDAIFGNGKIGDVVEIENVGEGVAEILVFDVE